MTVPVPGPRQGLPMPSPLVAGPPVPGAPPEQVPDGVAEALAQLDGLDGQPVGEHVEVFDGVHRLLQDALATLDEA